MERVKRQVVQRPVRHDEPVLALRQDIRQRRNQQAV